MVNGSNRDGNADQHEIKNINIYSPGITRSKLVPHRCNSAFCIGCSCKPQRKRRDLWETPLRTFTNTLLITLDVHPQLFPKQSQILDWLQAECPVSKVIYKLRQRCESNGPSNDLQVHSWRYIWALEFHESGVPHYHVVLDATALPRDVVQDVWNSLGPNHVLGNTHISARWDGTSVGDAARHLAGYLTKTPKHDYPEYVLERGGAKGAIHRWGQSKGLLPRKAKQLRVPPRPQPRRRPARRRTHAERIRSCGRSSHLILTTEVLNQSTGALDVERSWHAQFAVAKAELSGLSDAQRLVLEQVDTPDEMRGVLNSLLNREVAVIRKRNGAPKGGG